MLRGMRYSGQVACYVFFLEGRSSPQINSHTRITRNGQGACPERKDSKQTKINYVFSNTHGNFVGHVLLSPLSYKLNYQSKVQKG